MIEATYQPRQGYTLSRQEAISKLHRLTPGTVEHRQLQGALIKAAGIAEICLPNNSYKVDVSCDRLLGGFGSCEHRAIGEEVNLPEFGKNTPLLVKGPVDVKFPDIVALAGAYYGVANAAISLGGDPAARPERFINAFKTLEEGDNNQLRRIMLEIEDESGKVRSGGLPHHCYSSQAIETNRAMKEIKNDINDLRLDNSDHFFNDAKIAYEIGHACAIEEAKAAGKEKNKEKLKRAYAMDAFACRYLTGLFASGHVRNQRGELETLLVNPKATFQFSSDVAKVLAGILAGAQHEKEGQEGLNVENDQGDQWRAYGDGNYFTPKNEANRGKAIAAAQQSVNEISAAYNSPNENQESSVGKHIPRATAYNPPPLYSVENGALVLHQDGKVIPIQSPKDFYTKAIPLALRYLPEDYINGTINEAVKDKTKKEIYKIFNLDIDKPFAAKIANIKLMPRIERFTSTIWQIIGVATYSQVKKGNEEMDTKIHEMADGLKATYSNTVKILEQLEVVKGKLQLLDWDNKSSTLRKAIETIKKIANQTDHFSIDGLNARQALIAEDQLWDAYMEIATIFGKGTAHGQMILVEYQNMLESDKSLSKKEINTQVTQWFRQMLDCQVQAVSLYADYVIRRDGGYQELQRKMPGFQSNLLEQYEVNAPLINEELLFKSQSHFDKELSKQRLLTTALKQIEGK